MREHSGQKQGQQYQELDPSFSGTGRYRLPTIHRRSALASFVDFFVNGRYSSSGTYYLSDKEFINHIAIIILSAGIFGAGIGQAIIEIFRF